MTFFETMLGVAVVAIALWLLLTASPQGRSPEREQRERFARHDGVNARRRVG